MTKLKAFWYIYKNSLFNIKYYEDLLSTGLKFSIKYFAGLAFIAVLITTVGVTTPLIPQIKETAAEIYTQVEQIYPDDLVLSAEDGVWNINQEEPYAIAVPEVLLTAEGADTSGMPENLIVFDHAGTLDDLNSYNTFMLVNEVNLIALGSQGKVEVHPLTDIPDGEFSRTDFLVLMESLQQIIEVIPAIVIIFTFIGASFYYLILRGIYLLSIGLIMWMVGSARGMTHGYKTYLSLGAHSFTLPLTLEVLFSVLQVDIPVPFWSFAVNLIFGLVVLYFLGELKKEEQTK